MRVEIYRQDDDKEPMISVQSDTMEFSALRLPQGEIVLGLEGSDAKALHDQVMQIVLATWGSA